MEEQRNEKGQTLKEFLDAYRPGDYDRPAVTVDMAVFTIQEELLLIRRRDHPNMGKWALPGGFIEMGETLYQSAARELLEETSLKNIPLRSLGLFAAPDRDPRMRIITAAFAAEVDRERLLPELLAGDDAADARLFPWRWEDMGDSHISAKRGAYPDLSLPCDAAGQPYDKAGRAFKLTLTSENEILSARLALSKNGVELLLATPDPESPEDGALAGDHGLIIFSALRKLGKV